MNPRKQKRTDDMKIFTKVFCALKFVSLSAVRGQRVFMFDRHNLLSEFGIALWLVVKNIP